ncbi:MAG: hypothetical protein Q8R28_11635 [Dehalococcoidia bacterium]|nr:hypothetical protein [Dehalococcoidia bacterium]
MIDGKTWGQIEAELEQAVFGEVKQLIRAFLRHDYRGISSPYGDTDAGLDRWLKEFRQR